MGGISAVLGDCGHGEARVRGNAQNVRGGATTRCGGDSVANRTNKNLQYQIPHVYICGVLSN